MQRRFARTPPNALIGVLEKRVHDIAKPRADVLTIFFAKLF
jgi:hypothetical protein